MSDNTNYRQYTHRLIRTWLYSIGIALTVGGLVTLQLTDGTLKTHIQMLMATTKTDTTKKMTAAVPATTSRNNTIRNSTKSAVRSPSLASSLSPPSVAPIIQKQTNESTMAKAMAQLGSIFFDHNSSSIRTTCAELDTLNDKHGQDHALEVFRRCMKELERGQELVRSKIQNTQNNGMASCNNPQVFLHSFWDGPLERSAQLGLISSVYAHGPGCSKLTIWTTGARNFIEESLQPFLGQHFQVRTLNATQLIMDHIVPRYPELQSLVSQPKTAALVLSFDTCPPDLGKAAYSDLVRVLVLAAQHTDSNDSNSSSTGGGGHIYLDSDVLVLNSLAPLVLTHRDFWYQWSTTRFANTAIYSSPPGSPALKIMMEKILAQSNVKVAARSCHPWQMTRQVGRFVEMLPSAYFDPHWVMFDLQLTTLQKYAHDVYGLENFGAPFFEERRSDTSLSMANKNWTDTPLQTSALTTPHQSNSGHRESFFPGVFAYHWHNRFGEEFRKHSIAKLFWDHFEAIQQRGDYLSK